MFTTLKVLPDDTHTQDFLAEAAASKFDFHSVSIKAAGDEQLIRAVGGVVKQYEARKLKLLELPDSDKLRTLAGDIKQHALDHLDYYLQQLKDNVERNGGQVHFAATGADARKI